MGDRVRRRPSRSLHILSKRFKSQLWLRNYPLFCHPHPEYEGIEGCGWQNRGLKPSPSEFCPLLRATPNLDNVVSPYRFRSLRTNKKVPTIRKIINNKVIMIKLKRGGSRTTWSYSGEPL